MSKKELIERWRLEYKTFRPDPKGKFAPGADFDRSTGIPSIQFQILNRCNTHKHEGDNDETMGH